MTGSETQVEYATRAQARVVAIWTTAAYRLLDVAPQRLEPALEPIVASLVRFCLDIASRAAAGVDAAFILQHNYSPDAWNNAIYAGGFDKVLRTTVGKRTPWELRQLLVEVMSGVLSRP
jgi:hypothetical protein